MIRNLDGYFFRIYRNNEWQSICFSDLTRDEQQEVLKDRSAEWLKSLAIGLGEKIKDIGDELNIICD